MDRVRIAHISDLHFSKISLSPMQFFSKRWVGNLNLIFSRKREFITTQLQTLIPLFQKLQVDLVVVTGDLSTTSLKQEFEKAHHFLNEFKKWNMQVIAIPGNHDHYTKNAWRTKRFYQVLDDLEGKNYSLKKDGLAAVDLNASWMVVALDTALATSLTSSRGCFSEELEEKLVSLLSKIPPSKQILMLNHFPFFQHERLNKTLERADALKSVLKRFTNVRLYLNGHTHTHCVADLRSNGLPIVLDSGSAALQHSGSWNLLDLFPQGIELQAFKTISEGNDWQPFRKASWSF
jgi:3',5'-cyclic AMP phosphodiesterase CpdA